MRVHHLGPPHRAFLEPGLAPVCLLSSLAPEKDGLALAKVGFPGVALAVVTAVDGLKGFAFGRPKLAIVQQLVGAPGQSLGFVNQASSPIAVKVAGFGTGPASGVPCVSYGDFRVLGANEADVVNVEQGLDGRAPGDDVALSVHPVGDIRGEMATPSKVRTRFGKDSSPTTPQKSPLAVMEKLVPVGSPSSSTVIKLRPSGVIT